MYTLSIPFKEVKVRERAKKNGAKWNAENKTWEIETTEAVIDSCFKNYVVENKVKAEKMGYGEAYDRFGFDFAEEGDY